MISKKSTPASILSEVSFIQAARQQIFWCLADRESWPTTNSIPSDLDLADYSLNVDQVSNQDNPRDFRRYHYLRDGDRSQRTVYLHSHHSIHSTEQSKYLRYFWHLPSPCRQEDVGYKKIHRVLFSLMTLIS